MSAQNSKGIQTLLDAEREAQKIVQKARECTSYYSNSLTKHPRAPSKALGTDRTKRVKDARNEAQKEIEEYRKQKDDEFKRFEKEHTSGNKKAEEDANEDAEEKLKEIKSAGSKAGDEVVKELLRVVTDVKPEVPERITVPQEA
ncbi:hypothetical protein MMC07_005152 [Pseudocyphellaria aurata]|nr:hypothetical protein [Pseudocyphellaria aurata]